MSLLKKGSPELPSNHRSVSLLSTVGKLMERVIFKHMYNFLHINGLIYKNQSGFLPGHSTVYQLLDIYPSRELLRIKVTPDLHLTYSKNGGNLGLVLKMKNIACFSILLTKHVKYPYLYLFKFVLYGIVAFKVN